MRLDVILRCGEKFTVKCVKGREQMSNRVRPDGRGEQSNISLAGPADLSRREFGRTVGATALVAGASAMGVGMSHAGMRSFEPAGLRGTIRVGLIGCGGRGTGAAVQALRADPDAVLVAMGDVFGDRLEASLKGVTAEMGEAAAKQVKVEESKRFTGFDSYQKVVDAGVDVVLLCSYPAFRPAHLRAAIAAGKHVFAEKPLAVDGPGVRDVMESVKAAKEKNLGLLVGFCWRYHDGMRAMFEQVNSGALGDIITSHTTYHTSTLSKRPRKESWSDMEFQMRNWWHFTWISGDHIVEQAVHSIDRLAWSVGDRIPTKVTCLGGRAARSGPEHGNVFDHFAAIYEYEGGMRTFHTCRQIDKTPNDNTDYIYGVKGSAVVNGWAPTFSIKDAAGKETWKYAGRDDRDMYQTEHDDFFKSLRAGAPINDGMRGANSTLMAIMARMAAYTGATVGWNQALESKEVLVPEQLVLGDFPTPPVPVPGITKFI